MAKALFSITFALLLILSLYIYPIKADEEEEQEPPRGPNNVYQLYDTTFESFVKEHKYVIVKFYAEWCGHCKAFLPIFDEMSLVAQKQNRPYYFAEINANNQTITAEKYQIAGFPTIKLFVDGVPTDYEGDRNKESIIPFIEKRIGLGYIEITSQEELNEKMKMGSESVIGFFVADNANETAASIFSHISRTFEDTVFYLINPKLARTAFPDIEFVPSAAMVMPHGEKRAVLKAGLTNQTLEYLVKL